MTAINQYPNLCTSFEILNPPLLIPIHDRKKLKVEGVYLNDHQTEDYSDEVKADSEPKDSPQVLYFSWFNCPYDDQGVKRIEKENHKTDRKSYIKLSKEDSEKLNQSFAKNNYPTTEEMKAIACELGVSLLKIENWYKHHRRSLAKKGNFDIKPKKHFNVYELSYLNQQFAKNPRPEREEISEISAQINCTELQVKNWFLNKRKKVKSSQETSSEKEASETKLNLSSPYEKKETDLNFGDAFNPSTQMLILHSIQQANSLKNIHLLNQTKTEPENLQIPRLKLTNEYSAPNIICQMLESQRIRNSKVLNSIKPEIPVLNENYIRLLQSALAKQNPAYDNSQYHYNNHVNFVGFSPNIIVPKVTSLRTQQQQSSSNYGFSVNRNFQRAVHFSQFGEQ